METSIHLEKFYAWQWFVFQHPIFDFQLHFFVILRFTFFLEIHFILFLLTSEMFFNSFEILYFILFVEQTIHIKMQKM